MKLKVFSVRDEKVEAFMTPFYGRARGEAMRSFLNAVADEGHQFAKNADDYVLYEIGEFDDQSGLMIPAEPVRVISGLEARSMSASS